MGIDQVGKLAEQIGFEGAANASVLQGDQILVFAADDATILDEFGVDVDFAKVVDDDGHLMAFRIGEDMIDQGGFAWA